MLARGSAPLASSSLRVSLPPWPNTWISAVLATVAVPPLICTAPPLTRMFPAALRLVMIMLSSESPNSVSVPRKKLAVTAMVLVLSKVGPGAKSAPGNRLKLSSGQIIQPQRGYGGKQALLYFCTCAYWHTAIARLRESSRGRGFEVGERTNGASPPPLGGKRVHAPAERLDKSAPPGAPRIELNRRGKCRRRESNHTRYLHGLPGLLLKPHAAVRAGLRASNDSVRGVD